MDSIAPRLEPLFAELLLPVCAGWGLRLDQTALDRFALYAAELLHWNERINLTRITEPRAIVVRHFLDSLSCARAFEVIPASLADVGTGAGFPGIPLKIIWPETTLLLSDSVGKKTAFLRHVIEILDLKGVEVVTARAEDLGRNAAYREQYAGVVARAVAALDVLSEYCLPLCEVGGRFVAPKGADGATEAHKARQAISQLGGGEPRIMPITLPEVEPRTLVVVPKLQSTPPELPRPVGTAAKHPL